MKYSEKVITPQQVYGTVKDATCRECRFCDSEKDTFPFTGSRDAYCTRFRQRNDSKSRINLYDQACGKFKRRVRT